MFIALKDENRTNVAALWRVARSVLMSVRIIDSSNEGTLLRASLQCSAEGSLYTESSFLLWSRKLVSYLNATLGKTSRSLKKDVIWLQNNFPSLRYKGQLINRAMLHAAQSVVVVFQDDPGAAAATAALVRLSLQHGPDILSLHYTTMAQLASAVRRWSLDSLSVGETAAYVLDLLNLELSNGRPMDWYRRAQFELAACSDCEKFGHGCSKACKASHCWLRMALEKCRLHCWLLRSLQEAGVKDGAEPWVKALQSLVSPLATLEDDAKKHLGPWLEVLAGDHDQCFKSNRFCSFVKSFGHH